MTTEYSNDIYDLAIQIENELMPRYESHELYNKSERIIQEHGYELIRENIYEVPKENNNFILEKDHDEIIAEFKYDKSFTYIKFLLSDGRTNETNKEVEFVSNLMEVTKLPKKKC